MTELTITDKLRNLSHDIKGYWFTIRLWPGQHSQFLRCLQTKVVLQKHYYGPCIDKISFFSGVELIRNLQMCFNLNNFLRVQRSHRVIRIQPSIRVSGTSVSAANVSLSIKFFVVVHPVEKVHSRGDLLRSVPFRTVWHQKMCFWFLKVGAKSLKLWLVYV